MARLNIVTEKNITEDNKTSLATEDSVVLHCITNTFKMQEARRIC